MDTTNIIIPTVVCLTLAFVFYRRLRSKKPQKVSDQSQKGINEEEKKNILKSKKENIKEENIKEKEEEIDKEKEKEKEKKKELTYNMIFEKFCDYIQKNKLVSVDAISKKLNKTKEDTIKFLRDLENEGKMVGFLGEDGEYFYLSTKELDLLNNLLLKSKNKEMSEDELIKQFQQISKEGEQSII